jgi:hypothetical protein
VEEGGGGVGAAFYGFAESAVGPVHILKFRGEASLVGKNGANCWMFYIDRGLVLRRSTLKMQKYICFCMGRERFARGANNPPFAVKLRRMGHPILGGRPDFWDGPPDLSGLLTSGPPDLGSDPTSVPDVSCG